MGKIDKVKDKVTKKMKKVKGKVKKTAKGCAVIAFGALVICGCMDTNPASRATSAAYGDVGHSVKIIIEEKAQGNTVNLTMPVTLGDGALASADSSGSTETQTATPKLDIPVTVDARYNDAIAGATTASKGVLETLLQSSANKVLDLMASGESGTVNVTKTDGSTATVKCANGQCSIASACSDGSCTDK